MAILINNKHRFNKLLFHLLQVVELQLNLIFQQKELQFNLPFQLELQLNLPFQLELQLNFNLLIKVKMLYLINFNKGMLLVKPQFKTKFSLVNLLGLMLTLLSFFSKE